MRRRIFQWLALLFVLLMLPVGLAAADSDKEPSYVVRAERDGRIYVNVHGLTGDKVTLNGIRFTPVYGSDGSMRIKYSELVLAQSLNDCEDAIEKLGIDMDDVYIQNGRALYEVKTDTDAAPVPDEADIRAALSKLGSAVTGFYNQANAKGLFKALGMTDSSHEMNAVYQSLQTWPAQVKEISHSAGGPTLDALRSIAGDVYAGLNGLHEWLLQKEPADKAEGAALKSFRRFWRDVPAYTNLDMYKAWADGTVVRTAKNAAAAANLLDIEFRRVLYKNAEKLQLKGKHFVLEDDAGAEVKFKIYSVINPKD